MEQQSYYELACEMAIDAAESQPGNGRGIWHLEKQDLLCFYDKNPFELDADARRRQNCRIANRVHRAGIAVLAEAHDGREEATAMLFDCSWDRIPLVHQIICDEVDETLRERYSDF